MGELTNTRYEFGPFLLDPSEHVLVRDGSTVPLAPKVFDTLAALVQNSGRLVRKDELLAGLWPDTFVQEGSLARNVSDLRKALREPTGKPRFIETVPKSGYRFIAAVRELKCNATLILERHTRFQVTIDDEMEDGWAGRSMAVLPFKPLSQRENLKSIGLSIADALITRLSNVRQISVRPTSAVLKYARAGQDAVAAGRELKVQSVLDGCVQTSGARIRVTLQLVDVAEGASVWAERFDEELIDILAVEDSISEQVVGALGLASSIQAPRPASARAVIC